MIRRFLLLFLVNLGIMIMLGFILMLLGISGHGPRHQSYGPLLAFCAIMGFGGSFISLLISKFMAKMSTGAQEVDTNTPLGRWLYNTVDRQAQQVGITTPQVFIYESDDPNAFATGAFKNSAMVAVSTGLLNKLSKEEVEAVLGHEVGHIVSGDMVTMTLIQGVLNTFVMFLARIIGSAVDRSFNGDRSGPGPVQFIVTFVLEMLLAIPSMMIAGWFSRRREFVADRIGAQLTSKYDMANALRRLQSSDHADLPASLQAFGLHGSQNSFAKLMSTHPPIEERVEALLGYKEVDQ